MRRRHSAIALAGVAALTALSAATGGTFASFTAQTNNPNARVTAAADFRAPSASAALIFKTASPGSSTGFVKQGGGYRVYANVTDTGNPASGTSTVTSDVSLVTTGTTAMALTTTGGPFTVGGQSFNYRSAALTASNPVSEGSKAFTLNLTDAAANNQVQSGFSVTVDNTPPTASDIQTTNGGVAGKPDTGDTVVFTFSEPIDPDTVLSGWSGASQAVHVLVQDGGGLLGLGGADGMIVSTTADVQLPLGGVDLGRGDYTGTNGLACLLGGDAAFNSSTMVLSGSTITVTLNGTGAPCARTAGGNGTLTWGPSATPTDRAANAMSTTQRAETGAADKDF